MKLLILGGKGMAGHVMVKYFQQKAKYKVFYTSRDRNDANSLFLDLLNEKSLEEVIDFLKPDVVINCVGLLNENAAKNLQSAIFINSMLPHRISEMTESYGGRLIHISTDCVFSGNRSDYQENDLLDGTSVYAKTKALGEVTTPPHLTIRTSIIGPELKDTGIGLFLWFMKQTGEIQGYKKVMWNGVTTLELAKAVDDMINHNIMGLYHLGSSHKISKYELLQLIKKVFDKNDVIIKPDNKIISDRSIISTRTDYQYHIPEYHTMLNELKEWIYTS